MQLEKNLGTIDRMIRMVLAIALLLLIVTGTVSGIWAIILGILAVVFTATSVVGFCPLYAPFKFSTNRG